MLIKSITTSLKKMSFLFGKNFCSSRYVSIVIYYHIIMAKKLTHNSKLALKQYNFSIVVEHDKDGYFVFCPELQGCYTQGDTYEEALKNIRDAIKLHIKSCFERPACLSIS